MSNVGALLHKDLQLELRTKQSLPAMALFAVTTFVLFHFGLDRPRISGSLAAGVFWMTILFAALLGASRLFTVEQEQGGLTAFLLTPIDRSALFIAKALTMFIYLTALAVVALPAFALLLLTSISLKTLILLTLIVLLVNGSIAIITTLASALAVQTKVRELILPLVSLPLSIPIVLAASKVSSPLMNGESPAALPLQWLSIMLLYAIIFGLVSYAMFDFLLED